MLFFEKDVFSLKRNILMMK